MRTPFVISMFLLCASTYAQYDDLYGVTPRERNIPNEHKWTINNKTDSLEYEIAYMRYCLGHFHKQHNLGVTMQIVGATTVSLAYVMASSSYSGNSGAGLFALGGFVVTIVGVVIELDSFKWFKRASIRPSRYGVGLSLYF